MSSLSDPFLPRPEKRRPSFVSEVETLQDLEADTCTSASSRRSSWTTQRMLSLLSRLCTFLLALWGIFCLIFILVDARRSRSSVFRPSTLPPGANACDCGTTLQSAISKGCKYDSLAAAWLPARCRDDELTAEFEKAGPEPDGSWPYWADEAGRVRIGLDEIARLGPEGGLFWTTREWHVAHCMFYWRKLYRMRNTGAIMERRYDGEKHIKHCGRLAMRERPEEVFLVDVPVQMNSAVSLDPKKLPGMHGMLGEHIEEAN